jgi:hypothetical protein
VLEAAFVLLEVSSPSRRIFIGSHSLPPSLVRRIGPSEREANSIAGSLVTATAVDSHRATFLLGTRAPYPYLASLPRATSPHAMAAELVADAAHDRAGGLIRLRACLGPSSKPWLPIKGTLELPDAVSPSPPSASSAVAVKLLVPLDAAVHQPPELLPRTPWKHPEPHIVEERRYPRRNRSSSGCAASTSPEPSPPQPTPPIHQG